MWRHTNKSINAKHLTSEGKKLPSHFRQIVHDEREIHLEYLGIQLLQGHCSGSTDSTFFFTTDKFFSWQQSLDLADSVLKSYLNGIPTGLLCLLAPKCSSVRIKLWKKNMWKTIHWKMRKIFLLVSFLALVELLFYDKIFIWWSAIDVSGRIENYTSSR